MPDDAAGRLVYLNEAATSWPKAPGVAEAMADAVLQPPGRSGRNAPSSADRCPAGPQVGECRLRLAEMLGIDDRSRIVLPPSVTIALNLAIWGIGLRLSPRAHVITSVAEHNAVLRPLRHLQRLRGFRLTFIGLDTHGALDAEAFARVLTPETALVALMHASNVTGHLYDVAPLFAQAKAAGAVTLLDASQTAGHLPLSPEALHADLLAVPGHKGLRGPIGVGALCVASEIELEPLLVGGTGIMSELPLQPDMLPLRLEAGTPNVAVMAGLAAALRWGSEFGEAFRAREQRAAALLRSGLREIPAVTLIDDDPAATYLPVASFVIAQHHIAEVGLRLADEFGIANRAGLHCAPLIHEALGTSPEGTIRLSPSGFTTDDEIAYALEAVRIIAAT